MSLFRRCVVNLLFVCLALLAAVGTAELAFRVLPIPWKRIVDASRNFEYDASIKTTDGKWATFRNLHPPTPKFPGTYRILVLGDSMSWGDGIRHYQDTWPAVLQDLLQKQSGRTIEVINLGSCGFTTVNELEALQVIGLKYDPDLILHQFCLNDPLPSSPGLKHEQEDWLFLSAPRWVSQRLIPEQLVQNSYFFNFLNNRIQALRFKYFSKASYLDLYKPDFSGFIECRKALVSIASIGRGRRIPVVFVFLPNMIDGRYTRETYPYSKVIGQMETIAASSGMTVVGMLEPFIGLGSDMARWKASPFNGHPGEEACRLIAAHLSEHIQQHRSAYRLP